MYISYLTHFLDEAGNIPAHIPKQARKIGKLMASVVDETTKNYNKAIFSIDS